MKEDIQDLLIPIIKDSLIEFYENRPVGDVCLDLPQDKRFGDISTNIALRLSRLIRKSPFETATLISDRIKRNLENTPLENYIKEIKVQGAGFINFYLSDKYLYEKLKDIIIGGKNSLGLNIGKDKSVLVEFVSANPTGPLSVAHARQAVVGDVLANIFEFLGFEVKREYYLNDEGNQVNILGDSVRLRIKELNGERIDFPENYYQGDYIYDIARKVQAEKEPISDIGEYAVGYILDIIKKELDDFGVRFDYWYSQKKLRESDKINASFAILRQKGVLFDQDGALWLRSTEYGDDKDRVVIKSDGSYTYLAPDIAYHQEKYKRGFSWLINLWGPDHHGYINRLKASVKALGYDPDSLSIIIVQLATIFRQGRPVQMSTRRGQYITLREVLDEVGLDASRFFFLMRRTSSHLDFDLDIAKKQTSENPVYYVQYAHARICSILRNNTQRVDFKEVNLTVLKEKEEIELIKKILQFYYILNICYKTIDPYMLTVYLQELSETFHKFYDRHRVLGDNQSLTQARLAIIEATRIVIALGLELSGISRPEKM